MLSWSSRMASGTQSVAVKTTVLWWLREITAVTLWLHRRHFFRRVMVLFGSFIGLADTEGEKKICLMNAPCLLSIGFSLFAYCLMALEISHYFLPGAFSENVLSFVTAELRAQGAFLARLHLLGLRSGAHTQEN